MTMLTSTLMSIFDIIIAISYFAIPVQMIYYSKVINGLQEHNVLIYLFISFISLCGLSHLVTFWMNFWNTVVLLVIIKGLCALVSVLTAISLLNVFPIIFSYPHYTKQMEMEVEEMKLSEQQMKYQYEMLKSIREISASLRNLHTDRDILVCLRNEVQRKFNGISVVYVIDQDGNYMLKSDVASFPQRIAIDDPLFQKLLVNSTSEFDENDLHYSHGRKRLNDNDFGYENDVLGLGTFFNLYGSENGGIILITFRQKNSEFEDCKHILTDIANILSTSLRLSKKFELVSQQREELLEKNNLLVRAQKEVTLAHHQREFFSVMSHEMRTPLFAICALSKILLETRGQSRLELLCDFEENEDEESLSLIKKSGDMLLSIVDNILDFTKIDEERFALSSCKFSIFDAIEHAVDIVSLQIDDKVDQANLNIFVSPNVPVYLIGDRLRFSQILINLLSNAFKFIRNDGNIEVRVFAVEEFCTESSVCLKLEVQDNGIGIPKDALAKLYEMYFQADQSLTRTHGGISYVAVTLGAGLGLFIVKFLVELMNGSIYAVSELGKGSTFHITLFLEKCHEISLTVMKSYSFKLIYVDSYLRSRDGFVSLMSRFEISYETLSYFDIYSNEYDSNCAIILDLRSIEFSLIYEVWKKFQGRVIVCGEVLLLKKWKLYKVKNLPQVKIYSTTKPLKHSILEKFMDSLRLNKVFEDTPAESKNKIHKHIEDLSLSVSTSSRNSLVAEPLIEKPKIMVAEDNYINQIVLRKIFGKLHLDIVTVSNGQEAVDLYLRSPTFDIIFMDIMMPVKDGLQATKEIKAISSSFINRTVESKSFIALSNARRFSFEKPWIIAITANTCNDNKLKCLEVGINDFVPKPAHLQTIQEAIDRYECAKQRI